MNRDHLNRATVLLLFMRNPDIVHFPRCPGFNRLTKLCALLLPCLAALALEGCTSTPLGGTGPGGIGRKAGTEEGTSATASGDWPGDSDRDKSAGKPRYHRARPGESMADIAALYGMTVPQLLSSNHGLDPADGLKPGQLIYVPRQ